jgi:hypothetical protein
VLVVDEHTVLVGIGERTNRAGASRLEVLRADGQTARYDDPMQGLADQGVIDPGLTVHVAGRLEQYPRPEAHILDALREQWNDGAKRASGAVGYSRRRRTRHPSKASTGRNHSGDPP